jgi:hypothetical protein
VLTAEETMARYDRHPREGIEDARRGVCLCRGSRHGPWRRLALALILRLPGASVLTIETTVRRAHSADDGDVVLVSQLLNLVEPGACIERQRHALFIDFKVFEPVDAAAPQHHGVRVVELT